MKQSESITDLATALCLAQAEMGGAVKDSNNPFFKSSYADPYQCNKGYQAAVCKSWVIICTTTCYFRWW